MNWGMTLVGDSTVNQSRRIDAGRCDRRDGLVWYFVSPCMIDPKMFQVEQDLEVNNVYREKSQKNGDQRFI